MIVYTVTHTDSGRGVTARFESLNQFVCWVNCLRSLGIAYQVEFEHVNGPRQLEFNF